MKRLLLPLIGALSLSASAQVPAATSPLPPCHLRIYPDYTLGVMYRAVLRLSSGCPAGTTLRVRKSSTMNTRVNGAPYQPVRPLSGAWELGTKKSTIPAGDLWTLYNWRWEWYDARALNPLTGTAGRWRGGEVVHVQ